jgi:hypothetical protein
MLAAVLWARGGAVSPVPAFDARGLIPPFVGSDEATKDRSPYEVTMPEIVASLGTTQPRRELLKGLLDYRELLARLGYTDGVQFVDGSFAENVEVREGRDPKDIDVFSYLTRPARYQQDPALWAAVGFAEWSAEIADRLQNKLRFRLDTYAIAVDQHTPIALIVETVYWYSLFAHKKITHDWKGFLRVRLNPADDAAARALL